MGRIVIVFMLTLVACGSPEIRVRNTSATRLENVRVQSGGSGDETFGDIPAGAATAYREMSGAYHYGWIRARAEMQDVELRPVDYVGETPLGAGRYTYALDLIGTPPALALEFIED